VSQRRLIRLAVVTTWVTTGCNFLAFKVALESFPPLALMSVRLVLAAVVLVALALLSTAFGDACRCGPIDRLDSQPEH
jgi:hypothetical protein